MYYIFGFFCFFFFFQAEDGIRDTSVTGVQTCALPIWVRAETAGHAEVVLVEPPVDVHANSPDYDPGSFRADNGLDPDGPLLATVCRLRSEERRVGKECRCRRSPE